MLTASRFLDPRSDVVFKKVFGEHADLLISFLNGVMPLASPIKHITYLPSEQAPDIPELKRPIVDVRCEDAEGRTFIVEMQMEWSAAFSKRILYTVSQAYVHQLNRGQSYKHLCPVYGLALLNENCDESQRWYHHYCLQHKEDASKSMEGIEIILLELKKFHPRNWGEKRLGVLWLRFLKEIMNWQTIPSEFEESPEIVKACQLAQESAYSKAELRAYNEYWDAIQIEATLLEDRFESGEAKGRAEGEAKGRAEGEAKGRAEGEAKGRAEGEAKGRAEGEAKGRAEGEGQKAQEVALKLKAAGMSVDQISHITGLPTHEIE